MINFGNRSRRGKAKFKDSAGFEHGDTESPCKDLLAYLDESPLPAKPHNLIGYPVKIVQVEGRGRGLVAERSISAGDIVLRAARMGSAIRVRQDCLWCHECLQHRLEDWSPPLPVACSICEAVWCCTGNIAHIPPCAHRSLITCTICRMCRERRIQEQARAGLWRAASVTAPSFAQDRRAQDGLFPCSSNHDTKTSSDPRARKARNHARPA